MSILSRVAGPFVIPNVNYGDMQTAPQGGAANQTGFLTAKVIDFISDPKTLSEPRKDVIKSSVERSSLVNSMPINSIWCQIIEANRLDQHVAYPFFPAHLCLPIKPAEQVWVFYSGLDQVYYWVCRKPGDYISEDVNYTHIDRIVNQPITDGEPGVEPVKSAKAAFNGTPAGPVSFPQGKTDNINDKTSGVFFDDTQIIEQSQEYQDKFIQEAVPRLVRNPGDLIIQGSNNTAVILGSSDNTSGKGTIDIVAGRALKTQPVTNTRNFEEVDKTKTATSDGQVDFSNDDARIYLGMNEDVDTNFSVSIDGIPGSESASCAVIKSDLVRLLGSGNVKITSQASGASVVIQETGDVIVVPGSSGKVYLAGTDSNQAYLRYDEFKQIMDIIIPIVKSSVSAAITANTLEFNAGSAEAAQNLADIAIAQPKLATISRLLDSIKSQKILGT